VTTYVNAIMAEMVGYTVEELVGKPATDFLFPEDLPDFLKHWGTRRQGQPSRYERRLRKKDGSEAWFLASTTPLPGANGMLMGSLGMFTDITERRRAEELRDQIERTIQHDLRTPASSSIYLARMLHDIIGMTEEDHNLIEHFEQAGRDMLDTLNTSLDLYKIETKQFEYQPENVDCLALLQGLITSTARQPQFATTPMTLLLNGQAPRQDARCSCLGNTNLLRMSLQNLLINALEASPQGAPVVVALDSGTGCTITIRNTGVVPPEIRERFFDKYVTQGKRGGTGIGTYTAKMLVMAQGGEVTMHTSDTRNETVLTLWLPC
jgi:PAS domain S-box-containing protein